MRDDWRLANQKDYLYRATLKKTEFKASPTNDHEHCEFCWSKFGKYKDLLKSGYCTLDGYYWICDGCFRDFREQFGWELTEDISIHTGDGSVWP